MMERLAFLEDGERKARDRKTRRKQQKAMMVLTTFALAVRTHSKSWGCTIKQHTIACAFTARLAVIPAIATRNTVFKVWIYHEARIT